MLWLNSSRRVCNSLVLNKKRHNFCISKSWTFVNKCLSVSKSYDFNKLDSSVHKQIFRYELSLSFERKKIHWKKIVPVFFSICYHPPFGEQCSHLQLSLNQQRKKPIHLGWLLSEWVGINLQSSSIQCFLCALQNSLWHPHPQQLLKSSLTSSFHGYRITLTCMGSSPLSKPM